MKSTKNTLMATILTLACGMIAAPAAFAAPAFQVPESGATVAILALAIFGIEVVRRKLKK